MLSFEGVQLPQRQAAVADAPPVELAEALPALQVCKSGPETGEEKSTTDDMVNLLGS